MREEDDEIGIMAGDRRIARPDSALPDSIIPDAAYRPVPIAWFTAAFLIQMGVLFALFLMLLGRSGWFTIVIGTLATVIIAGWTWERGMKSASPGWQIATGIVLALQLGFICLGAAARL